MIASRVCSILACVIVVLHSTTYADGVKCYSCNSKDNAACISNVKSITTTEECPSGCYTSVDTAGVVTRGCLNIGECATTANCCATENCNANNICKSCDSSKDESCAQSDASTALHEICAAEATKCVVTINTDKHTVRRCATADDEKNCSGTTCKLSEGGASNVGIFPSDRRRCYQCSIDDTKCANVASNTDLTKPCALYAETESCYTFGTDDTHMLRGCVSDSADTNKCKEPASTNACATCQADNCNNRGYTYEQTEKCMTCNSKDDKSCAWGLTEDKAINCQNKIPYNMAGQCYTQTKDDVVYRGCFYDRNVTLLGESCNESTTCTFCSNNACNNQETNFTCIRCRSDNFAGCRNKADQIGPLACTNIITETNAECFWGVWNDVVIRGCLADVDERVLYECKDEKNKQCLTCETPNCNTAEVDGAATITISATLVLTLAVLTNFFKLH